MMAQSSADFIDAAKAWFFPLSAFAFVVVYPLLLFSSIVYQGYKASRASRSPGRATSDLAKARQPKLRVVACKDAASPTGNVVRPFLAQCAQSCPQPPSASAQRNLVALLTCAIGLAFLTLTGSALNFVIGGNRSSSFSRDVEPTQGLFSTGCIATSAIAAGMLIAAVKYCATRNSSFCKLPNTKAFSLTPSMTATPCPSSPMPHPSGANRTKATRRPASQASSSDEGADSSGEVSGASSDEMNA
mmetsp:Transcript_44999/g.84085  ORF Transcript_44999/g.84085 Transcript_44999/m.84085 type:complete len:245 (-) Transcript_44999:231-965(-)